ncbi:MAG: phosphatase [Lachnospiraceae bacterium]|nr:phosphatase [Lachnospiraceae bacterium]
MDLILDTHTHTIASGHAYNTINEMAGSAADKGLKLLAITDHAPAMPGSCSYMYFLNFRALRREKYGVKLLFGAELNIINTDGGLDLEEDILKKLDIGIASIHPPCYKEATAEQNLNAYIKAMENPYVNIIGHPDDGRFPVDMEKLVLAAKENHVLLEVNNASLNPEGFRQNTEANDLEMLKFCKKYGQPVVIGSDAHIEEEVGNFGRAMNVIAKAGFPEELVINTSIDKLYEYISKV